MTKKALIPHVEGKPILIDKKRTKFVRERTLEANKEHERSYLELAELLYESASGQYFKEWGFDRFEDYVMEELGWKERKGWYFVAIQKKLVAEGGIPKEDLREIEWTKASLLSRLPSDELKPGKIERWVKKAKTEAFDKLEKDVQRSKVAAGEKVKAPDDDDDKRAMTFQLYEAQYKNIKLALEIAQKVSGSEAPNHNLDMICLSFLADRMEEAGVKLNSVLDAVKRVYEVEVVAIKIKGKNEVVIYGGDFAKKHGIDTD